MHDEDQTPFADPAACEVAEPLIDAEVGQMPPPRPTAAAGAGGRLLLGAGLVIIALNLRPVFSSVAAVLPEILRSTGLGAAAAGLLTTLPVLCMGLFAPLAPRLAARFGAERIILWLLVLLGAGTATRGLGTVPALLAGATMAGGAIAIVNVLLPGLVKRDFPDRLALMTGLFTMALSAGAAAAAGLTVPLQHLLGGAWAPALAAWALPVAVALTLWLPQARRSAETPHVARAGRGALWRQAIAWQVTLFMGLQSAMAYCVFGFLAPILRDRGLGGVEAGLVVSASVAMQCLGCLAAPAIAVRQRDQRLINAVFFVFAVVGFLGCVFAPLSGVWLWAALSGLGQGGAIALAMTAIVLRSPDARIAADLSSMAQSVGYTLAALGPLLFGVLRGLDDSMIAASSLFVLLGVTGAVFSVAAGRAQVIDLSQGT